MDRMFAIIGIALFCAALMVGYYSSPFTPAVVNAVHATATPKPLANAFANSISVDIPAVDDSGVGRLAQITILATPGEGKVLIDLENNSPSVGSDTQVSIMNAVAAARKIEGSKGKNLDLRFSVKAASTEVSGQSAGAALAVATAALLEGATLRNDTIITGSTDSNGTIGAVGGVLEKAMAAKTFGFTRMLVPPGESVAIKTVEKCQDQQSGSALIRRCYADHVETGVAQEAQIAVYEVHSVQEALELARQ